MPNFNCGGGGCRSFSCSSCTDDATRFEYFDVLGSCRSDAEADKIMCERLAKKRVRENALIAAAPDLLAACEAVAATTWSKNTATIIGKQVRAAIAKAKGEKP